jgi:hypothetical protein
MKHPAVRTIVLTWLAWVFIVIGYQAWSTARFQPAWPDRALEWTTKETASADYQRRWPYLTEPFMNDQVAWDSEYYLGIATGGYDNPRVKALSPFGDVSYVVDHLVSGGSASSSDYLSLSYAFFPFYPLTIRLLSVPLRVLGLNPIATATLAGVIISALGALAGMLALYDLTRETLGEEGGLRAAFYLTIFPTGFFLVQVYTEGLFVGLAFWVLALLRRKQWLWAGILSVCATLTRAVGAALFVPLFIAWVREGDWLDIDLEWRQIYYYTAHSLRMAAAAWRKLLHRARPDDPSWTQINDELYVLRSFAKGLVVISPALAFLGWKFSPLGIKFSFVEQNYFGRGFLMLGESYYAWATALHQMLFDGVPERTAYYLLEFAAILLGIIACVVTWKRYPELAWFSLAVVVLSWGSGGAQGMHRYILTAPSVFVALARWGKNPVFDRAWTLASILLMGLLATLFAFNFWVA